MGKDRAARAPTVSLDGWLSLQGPHGVARAVRGTITAHRLELSLLSAQVEAQLSDPLASAHRPTVSHGDDVDVRAHGEAGDILSFTSVVVPHLAPSDPQSCETMAHSMLFGDAPASYRAVVLTYSVSELANALSSYCELHSSGDSPDVPVSASDDSGQPSMPTRIANFCQAAFEFPSIMLCGNTLTALPRLIGSLSALDAQLAEQLKVAFSAAQETAQLILDSALPQQKDGLVTGSEKWTIGSGNLPLTQLFEDGFCEVFADQISAFHRRLWRMWSPTSDISLLFHVMTGNDAWQLNPLVFDGQIPHFVATQCALHVLSSDIGDATRARVLEKWILIAARMRSNGDSVGWVAVLLVLFDAAVLRLSQTWTLVDRMLIARLADGWGYEAFEVLKRAQIPFLEKKAFRTCAEDMGRRVAKSDCVPYFGDAIVHPSDRIACPQQQLARIEAIVAGWRAFTDAQPSDVQEKHIPEDPMFQSAFTIWSQQHQVLDLTALSLAIQPKLLGYYLPNFYQQMLPLTCGAMIPVLFTSSVPNFRLFPLSTLMLVSQPKPLSKSRAPIRRSSSFPPAGPTQITGVSELDFEAREQLEHTASAHVLGQVVRDLLNVSTETLNVRQGLVFKAFSDDERNEARSSRTSSIIETLSKGRSTQGRQVVVKSASMVRLVDVLVLGASAFANGFGELYLDPEVHIDTLLASYRSFCSPAEMLDMLLVRVRCARGAARVLGLHMQRNGFYSSGQQVWQVSEPDDRTDATAVRILSMIVLMLKKWVADYFFDFLDDQYVLNSGSTLLLALRNEAELGGYPDYVTQQCRQVAGAFSRRQFSISSPEAEPPAWLDLIFDCGRQKKLRQMHRTVPELPVVNLEPDGGLARIDSMIDELDSLVADALSRITMVNWMKTFEVLEQQAAQHVGLFSYTPPQTHSEGETIIQNVFTWLSSLRAPHTTTRVLDILPTSVVALIRLHTGLVEYFGKQIADPTLAHAQERRERMVFLLKMLGVLRSRMQFLNLASEFGQQNQHIPSFLERALVASILLPESRAYAACWLAAGAEVAKLYPVDHKATANINKGNGEVPCAKNIYIPVPPVRNGRPMSVCAGWIIEQLLEIICCVPNTSVEHPDLINFDKRRYAYNLIKNMTCEFNAQVSQERPPSVPNELTEKYYFLFGDAARAASVPVPLLDGRRHKESLFKGGRLQRQRVFTDVVAQEMDKNKWEARIFDKIERSSTTLNPAAQQAFYGLPVSQSSTSLYTKRISKLITSTSTVDMASVLETGSGPTNTSLSAGSGHSIVATPTSSPSRRSASQSKRSRFGGLFRSVRPLSVLGSSGAASSGTNLSHLAPCSPSQSASQNPSLYNHSLGSSSSLQSDAIDDSQSEWVPDETIDLAQKPATTDFGPEDWMPFVNIDFEMMMDVQLVSPGIMSLTHRSGQKPEKLVFRGQTTKITNEWVEAISKSMKRCLMKSTRVFGVPLDIVCDREERLVPAFLESMLRQIEERGLEEVGIYRISGSIAAVNSMKQWFDQGNHACRKNDLRWSDINAVAGCIKLYLRELPKPLMTDELLPEFMRVISPSGVDVILLRTILKKLPEANYYVLRRISRHLKLIVDHSATNKMSVQNIAIVFSVNFLPPVAMSQMGGMQQLVSTLVLQQNEVFTADDLS